MLRVFFFSSFLFLFIFGSSQTKKMNVINTAVPFLNIPTDARSGAMGEVGASTSADSYSQNWNVSKYAFLKESTGIAFSYSPWMNDQIKKSFLGNIFFYSKINTSSAWAVSFKYFSLENVEDIDDLNNGITFNQNMNMEFIPRELSLDASYSMKLAEYFSMGVALRYIYSNIADRTVNQNYQPASSIGVDVSAFFEKNIFSNNNPFRLGLNISNIGSDVSYGNTQKYSALPSNLRLGISNEFPLSLGILTVILETNKLLVETPDSGGGVIKNDNSGGLSSIFKSLYKAPGGFSEKIKEFSIHMGMEYNLRDQFFFRTGFTYEDPYKGYRRYVTLGIGFVYNYATLGFSYLYSLAKIQTPLDNGVRLSLAINFDKFDL